jgi:hypothetical protein
MHRDHRAGNANAVSEMPSGVSQAARLSRLLWQHHPRRVRRLSLID